MTPRDIKNLVFLAEQTKARDQTVFANGRRKHQSILDEIDGIHQRKQEYGLTTGNNFSAISKWQRWAEVETSNLKSRAQHILLENDALRKTAAKSAAKVQVLEVLLEKALKEVLHQNRRRAEQNGVPPDA